MRQTRSGGAGFVTSCTLDPKNAADPNGRGGFVTFGMPKLLRSGRIPRATAALVGGELSSAAMLDWSG
jgi:hypothetical protein